MLHHGGHKGLKNTLLFSYYCCIRPSYCALLGNGNTSKMIDQDNPYILCTIAISFLCGAAMTILIKCIYQPKAKRQYNREGNGHSYLVRCTCDETARIHCEKHDPILLVKLSENLPTDEVMRNLGLTLGININVIKACRVDHSNSITDAVFEMLYHKWYKTQDGLGLRSEGLKELERALMAKRVGQKLLISTIVRQHYLGSR